MCIRTINEKAMNLKKNEKGHRENLMGGKGEGELCNYIIISKNKRNNENVKN